MNSVLIIGKPNSGKSLLFNRLTGLSQKVANFPGVTVEVKTGDDGELRYTDYPGIYSFNALTRDEEIAVKKFRHALGNDNISAVVCTLDATRLERSLVLGLQVQKEAALAKKPVIFALNMIDELEANGTSIDTELLSKKLSSPVVGISAKKRVGLDTLRKKMKEVSAAPEKFLCPSDCGQREDAEVIALARQASKEFGPKTEVFLKNQNTLDRFFLSGIFGGVAFFAIMAFLFQSIFTWASPLMDLIEELIGAAAAFTTSFLSEGILFDFINDAIFGGFGSFLVFVPQIFILTFIIGLLEDSGYLARAAVICHKPLSLFGLSGRSFVPLLSGHACAIPAIYAARTIESPKKRILTVLAIPLMACSARLPVYSLLIAALIPATTLFGVIGMQGLTFFALYAFGLFVALIVSGIISKTVYKTESDSPFIIELPPYRWPSWKPLLQRATRSATSFVVKAGGVIFTVTVVVWALGYFPNGAENLESSYLAMMGKWIEPIFQPLGLDWKFGVAILASFLAREVFVGTLGTMFGIEGADENIAGLASNLQGSGFTLASGVALLVFYAIALQCVSTVAVIKQETQSSRFAILTTVAYGVVAYILALLAYNLF